MTHIYVCCLINDLYSEYVFCKVFFCWTLMLITKNSVFIRIVTGIWRVHITVTCILVNILAIFSLRKNETGQYISIKSTINWLSVTIIASCRKQTTFSCLIFLHIVFSFAENQLSLNQIHIRRYVALCINLYLWITIFEEEKKRKQKQKLQNACTRSRVLTPAYTFGIPTGVRWGP